MGAQAVGRIGGERRVGLGLQGPQAPAGQPRAQGLTVHAVAQPRLDLQAAGPVVALMMVENCHHLLFLNGSRAPHGPGRRDVSPGVVTVVHHTKHLAKLLDRVASEVV